LLKTRQWADFRDLRHADVISEKVARHVARLAEDMRRTLYRERRPPPRNDAPAGDAPRGDGPPHPSSGGPGEWFQSLLQAHPSGHWVGRALVAAGLMIVAGVLMGATGAGSRPRTATPGAPAAALPACAQSTPRGIPPV
jgi:hypothetical protein